MRPAQLFVLRGDLFSVHLELVQQPAHLGIGVLLTGVAQRREQLAAWRLLGLLSFCHRLEP